MSGSKNDSEVMPAKVVSALVHRNILQEVLTKETLN